MQNILTTIAPVAVSDLSVRIVGENGSGKEWLARVIHKLSSRADSEFIHLDCSAIPYRNLQHEIFGSETIGLSRKEIRPGLLETANGGTIYFDKISTLPLFIRLKIITAFERQHFRRIGGYEEVYINVRAIEGINKPVDENVLRTDAGRRNSIRLGQVCINMPPLRERRDDIPSLVAHFIEDSNNRYCTKLDGIATEALESCMAYDWPGNIQELRNVVEYAAMMCRNHRIDQVDLPPFLQRKSSDIKDRYLVSPVLEV